MAIKPKVITTAAVSYPLLDFTVSFSASKYINHDARKAARLYKALYIKG
ncbi:MAG: hypothetical protein QNK15_05190 [Cycloclasticus sp.]|nr:hypothetical protein [Cycloclasticus sp.]